MNIHGSDPTQTTRLTPISQAATYADIGEFWDTHSGADYWDQMVEVEMTLDPAARRHTRSIETGNLTPPPPETPNHDI